MVNLLSIYDPDWVDGFFRKETAVKRTRPERPDVIFNVAYELARLSTCTRKSVGCVIADREGRFISTGYNGAPAGFPHCADVGCIDEGGHCVRAVHAEMNAIFYAAKRGIKLDGGIAYCTLLPCINCFNAMVSVGVRTIWYDQTYDRPERETLIKLAVENDVYLQERIRYDRS